MEEREFYGHLSARDVDYLVNAFRHESFGGSENRLEEWEDERGRVKRIDEMSTWELQHAYNFLKAGFNCRGQRSKINTIKRFLDRSEPLSPSAEVKVDEAALREAAETPQRDTPEDSGQFRTGANIVFNEYTNVAYEQDYAPGAVVRHWGASMESPQPVEWTGVTTLHDAPENPFGVPRFQTTQANDVAASMTAGRTRRSMREALRTMNEYYGERDDE